VRFFRIPGFTGIEAHRDDADRGSLRIVEGCLPFGTGGLRSGPAWEKIGSVDRIGDDDRNHVSAADDGNGNSMIFVSRNCEIHDLVLFSEENTKFESLGISYDVAVPVEGMFSRDDATISSIGNRLYAIGDGSQEAMYIGKGPVGSGAEVYPDETLYTQEWSRFPKCQYYARGPKATIFAAGNPDKPLTVYISEPAGLTASFKDSPYSTEDTSDLYNAGKLSTVDILGSDASKITALSTRGEQVVVHTDKGAFLLYAPTADQASTGYRVEQAPATNFSSAVNHKVVSGEGGTQTFWIGHDGQVYKDEAASRGSAELKSNSDQDQANWKSKGVWEHELPTDLSGSFSAFSGQTGNYFFFVESDEAANFNFKEDRLYGVTDPNSQQVDSVVYVCGKHGCDLNNINSEEELRRVLRASPEIEADTVFELADLLKNKGPYCCKPVPGLPDPDNGLYETCKECQENSELCNNTGCCCGQLQYFGLGEGGIVPREATQSEVDLWDVEDWFKEAYGKLSPFMCCPTLTTYTWKLSQDQNFGRDGCTCVQTEEGDGYPTQEECIAAAVASGECTWDYNECGPCEKTKNGSYLSEKSCKKAIANDPNCEAYNIVNCSCVKDESGKGDFASLADCEAELNSNVDYENCWKYLADESSCSCSRNSEGIFDSSSECEDYLLTIESCVKYDLIGCDCLTSLTGAHDTIEACEAEADKIPECLGYKLEGCKCVVDNSDNPEYESLELCDAAAQSKPECDTWDLVKCSCERNDLGAGSYPSLELCEEDARSADECKKYTIKDCECIESETGTITGKSVCETILEANTECKKYTLTSDCECIEDDAGSFESLNSCEIERQKCAEYGISNCTCRELEGGPYIGLEACYTALDEAPYDEECAGFSFSDCSCVADPSGPFSTMSDCQTALAIDEACNGFWRFPKTFKFDGAPQENQCKCQPTSIDAEGMFADYHDCQHALSLIRPIEDYPYCWSDCEYDGLDPITACCLCSSGPFFSSPLPCDKPSGLTPSEKHDYCSSNGGSSFYIQPGKCDYSYTCYRWNEDGDWVNICYSGNALPEDLVNYCTPRKDAEPGDENICEECPQLQYELVIDASNACYCKELAPGDVPATENTFSTIEECYEAQNNTCKMFKPHAASCSCLETFEGSTQENPAFEREDDCLQNVADNNPECAWHSISDSCECVEDAQNGIYLGINNCEAALKILPGCEDHYVNELCECVISEPEGNTDPPYRGIIECQNALLNGDVERCDTSTYDLSSDCDCIKREDGSGQYTGLDACEAARDASEGCKAHWISEDCTSCTTIDPADGSTGFANKAACEDAIANNQLPERCITYYWADENCESCTTTDPGDGSPKFTSQNDCLDALDLGQIARCCSTDLQYEKNDTEQVCFSGDSITPNASQCDCIEAGYDIFEL
jgi:hypothetical protein